MSAAHRGCIVLAALATLLYAGCDVLEFEHPLSDEKTSKLDERLLGEWVIKDDTSDGLFRVTRVAGSKDILEVSSHNPKEEPFRIYTTEIQKQHYVSVETESPEDRQSRKWGITRYEFAVHDGKAGPGYFAVTDSA